MTFAHRRGVRSTPVFSDFSWSVPADKRVLLLGPNGAGKSTLLELLSGIRAPQKGRIMLDGESGRHRLVSQVAMMPQTISAFRGLTVEQQVAYSTWLRGTSLITSHARARQAVARVQLQQKAGSGAHQLSGGQLRRVGIAEAMASGAAHVLLDEPTAGLDPAQRQTFLQILDSFRPEGSLVVSTHHIDDVGEFFDHITVLAAGRILFDGDPGAFRELGPRYASYDDIFVSLVQGGLD